MTFLNKSLWASGFSGQKRSIDCGDRFGPLDTGRVHSWSLEEPKYCKLVHSQEKYVEIQPLNNWPEMSFGQNLRHLMIFLWIVFGWLLWAKTLWRGHTWSILFVENSAIIFSVFIFEPWEFLLQVASPILPVLSAGRDDPALILCSTLIQMPALSAPWEGNSQKQFFLSAKWSAAGCSTCRSRQEGRVKHVIVIFLLGASKEVALTQNPRMKKFHESAIQPHISQSNKGKAPFRDCVEWIEFYWQRGSIVGGGEHVFHISHEHGAASSCCRTFEKQRKRAQMKPLTLSLAISSWAHNIHFLDFTLPVGLSMIFKELPIFQLSELTTSQLFWTQCKCDLFSDYF